MKWYQVVRISKRCKHYANAPRCYVIRTLRIWTSSVLLQIQTFLALVAADDTARSAFYDLPVTQRSKFLLCLGTLQWSADPLWNCGTERWSPSVNQDFEVGGVCSMICMLHAARQLVLSIWWDILVVICHLEAVVVGYYMALCLVNVMIGDVNLIHLALAGSKGRFLRW